jgi:hypothetical protein
MSSQVAYRLGDGAPVTIDSARAIWAAVAREVLEDASRAAPVAHSELARQVQQRSGVYTRMPVAEWLPAVLADLDDAELAARLRPDTPRTPVRTPVRAATAPTRRARVAPATRKRQEEPPAICPSCFTQLPVSGRCDTCA